MLHGLLVLLLFAYFETPHNLLFLYCAIWKLARIKKCVLIVSKDQKINWQGYNDVEAPKRLIDAKQRLAPATHKSVSKDGGHLRMQTTAEMRIKFAK